MAKYRNQLPQLGNEPFLTDGGIETTLIFLNGIDLPLFASFDLLKSEEGVQAMREYFKRHASIARDRGVGFILEAATWRSSPDWGAKLGYDDASLDAANRKAIEMLVQVRDELETVDSPMVISGCIGPRGDGYQPGNIMSADEAQAYHSFQARIFAQTDADQITALTMNNVNEAIGVTRAAKAAGIPAAIGFTVETDGKLPTGQPLGDAIEQVDADTSGYPAYFLVNCAHPVHFDQALVDASWARRVRGIRANASRMSHAELDNATELDAGNPKELGQQYAEIRRRLPWINVLGGCCGTDHRHIEQIAVCALL